MIPLTTIVSPRGKGEGKRSVHFKVNAAAGQDETDQEEQGDLAGHGFTSNSTSSGAEPILSKLAGELDHPSEKSNHLEDKESQEKSEKRRKIRSKEKISKDKEEKFRQLQAKTKKAEEEFLKYREKNIADSSQ